MTTTLTNPIRPQGDEPEPTMLSFDGYPESHGYPTEGVILRRKHDGAIFLWHASMLYRADEQTPERARGEARWLIGQEDDTKHPTSGQDPSMFTLTRFPRFEMGSGPWPPPKVGSPGVTEQPEFDPGESLESMQERYRTLRQQIENRQPEREVQAEASVIANRIGDAFNEESREADMCSVYDSVVTEANDLAANEGATCLELPERNRFKTVRVGVDVPYVASGTTTIYVEVEVPVDRDGEWDSDDVSNAVEDVHLPDHYDPDDIDLDASYLDVQYSNAQIDFDNIEED